MSDQRATEIITAFAMALAYLLGFLAARRHYLDMLAIERAGDVALRRAQFTIIAKPLKDVTDAIPRD